MSTISVVLYTSEQFRDITRAPSWAAGAYDGTIRVPMRGALDEETELDRVLAHEFTHSLVRTLATRSLPAGDGSISWSGRPGAYVFSATATNEVGAVELTSPFRLRR